MRVLLAGLLMLGWIVAGNHCALGLMSASAEKKAETCPGCHTPSSPKLPASGGMQECCRALPSLPADLAKVQVAYDATLFAVLDFGLEEILAEVEAAAPRSVAEPPEVRTFSELVLQRSLRSHAPPVQV
jgi:hypothetical protein